jgi:hypothetical protein
MVPQWGMRGTDAEVSSLDGDPALEIDTHAGTIRIEDDRGPHGAFRVEGVFSPAPPN